MTVDQSEGMGSHEGAAFCSWEKGQDQERREKDRVRGIGGGRRSMIKVGEIGGRKMSCLQVQTLHWDLLGSHWESGLGNQHGRGDCALSEGGSEGGTGVNLLSLLGVDRVSPFYSGLNMFLTLSSLQVLV